MSKTLTNAVFVYLPLIYKYDTDLARYPSDFYVRFINVDPIKFYIPQPDIYKYGADLYIRG